MKLWQRSRGEAPHNCRLVAIIKKQLQTADGGFVKSSDTTVIFTVMLVFGAWRERQCSCHPPEKTAYLSNIHVVLESWCKKESIQRRRQYISCSSALEQQLFWPRWAFNLLFTVVCLTMASRWKPRESVKEAEYFEEIESKFWFILDWRFFGENAWWHLCQHKTPILFVFWLLWLKTTD